MPSNRVVFTLTGLSSTAGFSVYPTDWMKRAGPFNVGIGVTSTSTSTWNLEGTMDYTGSSTFNSTAATWFSSLASALTSNALIAVTVPVTALRLNLTAGSSQGVYTVTFLSAG